MYDVVIIGSGAAGLTTALNICNELKVLILTASKLEGANTKLAQGGIAASWQASESDIESHIKDTLVAGSHTNNQAAVRLLIEESSAAIDFLIEQGVEFDKCGDNYDLTAEGAHSIRRIFHADGDATGRVIFETLLAQAIAKPNITIIDEVIVNDVSEISLGQYQINFKQQQITTNNLVIACGGYGNLFNASTSTKYINGTNLIIAKQLGLAVSNLHLLQFHPTGFKDYHGKYHLLTEALRGEGAKLYSPEAGYFMANYHPLADLAPRDITSRTVAKMIANQQQVYLDCSQVNQIEQINQRFNTVAKTVGISGLSLATDKIPICPVAHYSIGGIITDLNGLTNKPGVYAVGESAMTGVHGSNRLASNSLLECVVFGRRIGNHIRSIASYPIIPTNNQTVTVRAQVYEQVKAVLTEYCGIVRYQDKLQAGLQKVDAINPTSEVEQQLLAVTKEIIQMCIENDSTGCHEKESYESATNY